MTGDGGRSSTTFRGETFFLRRVRIAHDVLAISESMRVDDAVSAMLNYREGRWPPQPDGSFLTNVVRRKRQENERPDDVQDGYRAELAPFSFRVAVDPGSGERTARFDLGRFSSWAKPDHPATITFGADGNPGTDDDGDDPGHVRPHGVRQVGRVDLGRSMRLGEEDQVGEVVDGAGRATISQLSNDAALRVLDTRPSGLSMSEAQRRLQTYGPNRVEQPRGESLLVSFLKQFTHFFAVILWVAAALAFFAEWSAPGQGMAKVGVAIVVVIVVSGVFSFWQEYRAEQTLAALRQLLPQQAEVLREGKAVEVPIEQLVPGDIVLLEQGDHIPADCRLIEAFGVRVNNAVITGESLSAVARGGTEQRRRPAAQQQHPARRHLDGLGSGEGGRLRHRDADRVRQDRAPDRNRREHVSPLRQEIAHLSRLIGVLAVLIGVLFFVVGRHPGRAVLGRLHLRDRHHRRQGAGGAAPDADAGPRAGHPAHGAAQRADPPPAVGRDARLHDRDLHRQDRHADPEPHAGEAALPGRTALRVRSGPSRRTSWPSPTGRSFSSAGHLPRPQRRPAPGAPLFLGDPMEVALVEMALTVLPTAGPARAPGRDPVRRRPHADVHGACHAGRADALLQGRARAITPLCRASWSMASCSRSRPSGAARSSAAQNAMARAGPARPGLRLPSAGSRVDSRSAGAGSGVGRAGRR